MKKLLKVFIPVLILAAIVAGLGLSGILPIPGLTPKKVKSDWQAKLKTIYAAKGSFTGDTVKFKNATPEEVKAFVAAAVTGKLEPVQAGATDVKSKKLIDWLKKEAAAKETPKVKPVVAKTPDKVAAKPKDAPTIDPKLGEEKLAGLWEEIGADRLGPVIEKWKDADLAKIFAQMDDGVVANVLAKMKPERASALSKAIQKEASIIPVEKA